MRDGGRRNTGRAGSVLFLAVLLFSAATAPCRAQDLDSSGVAGEGEDIETDARPARPRTLTFGPWVGHTPDVDFLVGSHLELGLPIGAGFSFTLGLHDGVGRVKIDAPIVLLDGLQPTTIIPRKKNTNVGTIAFAFGLRHDTFSNAVIRLYWGVAAEASAVLPSKGKDHFIGGGLLALGAEFPVKEDFIIDLNLQAGIASKAGKLGDFSPLPRFSLGFGLRF